MKFDPLVGSRKNLLNSESESEVPSEEEVNSILERINANGIKMLEAEEKATLDRYSAYLNKSKSSYADGRKR